MKTRIRICIAAMTLSILLAFAFAGCSNKSGNTIDEPEITADYLIEDYSQQLITDGGENMLGHVTMEKQATHMLFIFPKEKWFQARNTRKAITLPTPTLL